MENVHLAARRVVVIPAVSETLSPCLAKANYCVQQLLVIQMKKTVQCNYILKVIEVKDCPFMDVVRELSYPLIF